RLGAGAHVGAARPRERAEPRLERGGDGPRVLRRDPAHDELVDHELDHCRPSDSESVSERSAFAYSTRAARSTWAGVIAVPSSAASNAAESAIERIEPPDAASFASAAKSMSSSGADGGNMRRQISARCGGSGNGNWTTKRSRRRKARSTFERRFVVRIA